MGKFRGIFGPGLAPVSLNLLPVLVSTKIVGQQGSSRIWNCRFNLLSINRGVVSNIKIIRVPYVLCNIL